MHWFCTVSDFSRQHCLGICAFLVPANLIATATLLVLHFGDFRRLWQMAVSLLAAPLALVMILHVYTWFAVGVVAGPTFILLALACLCLGLNIWMGQRRRLPRPSLRMARL